MTADNPGWMSLANASVQYAAASQPLHHGGSLFIQRPPVQLLDDRVGAALIDFLLRPVQGRGVSYIRLSCGWKRSDPMPDDGGKRLNFSKNLSAAQEGETHKGRLINAETLQIEFVGNALIQCRMMEESGSFASLDEYKRVRGIAWLYNETLLPVGQLFKSGTNRFRLSAVPENRRIVPGIVFGRILAAFLSARRWRN